MITLHIFIYGGNQLKILTIILFLFAFTNIEAKESKTNGKFVTVVTLNNYAPFIFASNVGISLTDEIIPPGKDSKKFKGFSWDTLRESFHAMGYTIHLNVRPWKRSVKDFEKGKFEILFPTTKTPEREKKYFYSTEDTNYSTMNIYTRKDSTLEFNDLESLKEMEIGVIRGYSYGAKWEASKFLKTLENDSDQQNFNMLSKGRIPAMAAYAASADYWLIKNKKKDKFKKHKTFDFTREYLVGLPSNEKSIQKVKDFDLGKKKIIDSGLYAEIKKKWGE